MSAPISKTDKAAMLERYRGMWTDDPEDIPAWMNRQVKQGYEICSITACTRPMCQGEFRPGVYVLMQLAARPGQ